MRAVGISIDCREQYVSFTDKSAKALQRIKLKVLLDKNIENSGGIAVNPELGFVVEILFGKLLNKNSTFFLFRYIFWTDWNQRNPNGKKAGLRKYSEIVVFLKCTIYFILHFSIYYFDPLNLYYLHILKFYGVISIKN